MTMFFIKAVLMSLLPFYRVEFPAEEFPKDFAYIEYSHGQELGKRTVNENDSTYTALKKLISDEKQGWRYDLTTYAPNHIFNSPKLKINCFGKTIVVNYEKAHNGWVQISKNDIKGSCPSVHLDSESSKPDQ